MLFACNIHSPTSRSEIKQRVLNNFLDLSEDQIKYLFVEFTKHDGTGMSCISEFKKCLVLYYSQRPSLLRFLKNNQVIDTARLLSYLEYRKENRSDCVSKKVFQLLYGPKSFRITTPSLENYKLLWSSGEMLITYCFAHSKKDLSHLGFIEEI